MPKTVHQTDKTQGIEYTIYTVSQEDGPKGAAKKQDMKTDRGQALAAAEELHNSGKFLKVEVRQKYFDKKKNRDIDIPLKAFETKAKKEIGVALILVIALLCGGIAFAAAYFLTR